MLTGKPECCDTANHFSLGHHASRVWKLNAAVAVAVATVLYGAVATVLQQGTPRLSRHAALAPPVVCGSSRRCSYRAVRCCSHRATAMHAAPIKARCTGAACCVRQ
jgi:heme exporter protein D